MKYIPFIFGVIKNSVTNLVQPDNETRNNRIELLNKIIDDIKQQKIVFTPFSYGYLRDEQEAFQSLAAFGAKWLYKFKISTDIPLTNLISLRSTNKGISDLLDQYGPEVLLQMYEMPLKMTKYFVSYYLRLGYTINDLLSQLENLANDDDIRKKTYYPIIETVAATAHQFNMAPTHILYGGVCFPFLFDPDLIAKRYRSIQDVSLDQITSKSSYYVDMFSSVFHDIHNAFTVADVFSDLVREVYLYYFDYKAAYICSMNNFSYARVKDTIYIGAKTKRNLSDEIRNQLDFYATVIHGLKLYLEELSPEDIKKLRRAKPTDDTKSSHDIISAVAIKKFLAQVKENKKVVTYYYKHRQVKIEMEYGSNSSDEYARFYYSQPQQTTEAQ